MSSEALPFPSGLERMERRDEVLARPVRKVWCATCERSVPTTRGLFDGHGLVGAVTFSWELCPASGSRPGVAFVVTRTVDEAKGLVLLEVFERVTPSALPLEPLAGDVEHIT